MTEQVQRPPDKLLCVVLEDEIEMIKEQGPEKFQEFQQGAITSMDKELPGLGRYLQEALDKAPTSEERDRIFEVCYIFYHMRDLPTDTSKV